MTRRTPITFFASTAAALLVTSRVAVLGGSFGS